MKELDSFTVEQLTEFIESDHAQCGDVAALAKIVLLAKQADPVSFIYTGEGGYYGYAFVDANEDEIHIKDDQKLYLFPQTNQSELADSVNEFLKVLDDYKDQLVPINRNSALVNDLRKALSSVPRLKSPEIPDYKSALLGLLTNRISKDYLGFFTLAGINKTNLARAVEVSEATINFENVPQVKIGECLIPNGWLITQDWIKCSDHKPDSSGEFLVYETLNNRVQHDYWVPGDCAALGLGFWNHYANYVTHWMPLPTAPEKP